MLWESSRMMLPEHKAILKEHEQKRTHINPKTYDEQLLEEMSNTIEQLYSTKTLATFTYYEDHTRYQLEGTVDDIDKTAKQVVVKEENTRYFINFLDFISIDV